MEKTVTFRHFRSLRCFPNELSEKEMRNQLIESELKRGYIPIKIKYHKVKYHSITAINVVEYDEVYCESGYAGKKQARILFNKLTTQKHE